jgi:hypothetical protein
MKRHRDRFSAVTLYHRLIARTSLQIKMNGAEVTAIGASRAVGSLALRLQQYLVPMHNHSCIFGARSKSRELVSGNFV